MKIGVVSDTHSYFDPRIPKLLGGVEHILHGGDIGQPQILHQLEAIAPVTAVCGNTDDPGFGYRLTETVELEGMKVLLHHIVNPYSLTEEMDRRITAAAPTLVVFGHTHKPFELKIGGVHFLNPGYAGKARFGLPRSLAIAHVENGQIRIEFVFL